MADGNAIIVLRDGLGTISGVITGERRTDSGDYLVMASSGEYSAQGEIIDNQVAVGKIASLTIDGEVWGFSPAGDLDSRYLIGECDESESEPVAETVATTDQADVSMTDVPTIVSAPSDDGTGQEMSTDETAVDAESSDGETTQDADTTAADDTTADTATAVKEEESPAAAETEPIKKAPRAKKTA